MIVGYGPGGGYDIYGRMLARHMGKYIPGNPTIIIKNMPGAGSLRAANYIYNVAPKDGTAFGIFARNIPLLGAARQTNQNVQFDPRKFTWLGSSSSFDNDAYLLIVRKDAQIKIDRGCAPARTARRSSSAPPAKARRATPCRSSCATCSASTSSRSPAIRDSGALFLAMERGEIEGRTAGLSTVKSNKPDWLKPDGIMQVLVAFGADDPLSRTSRTCRPRANWRRPTRTAR